MKKISLIGAGNIGGTLAHLLGQEKWAEVLLLDVDPLMPAGKSLDIKEALVNENYQAHIDGGNEYALLKNSDVIVVTAGIARKPGMNRDDLVQVNANVIKNVAEQIKKHASHAFVIVVTNPLDAMVFLMQRTTGFHPQKVVGMAGILDTARFVHFLSEALKVHPVNIKSIVCGGHGDTMVPLLRFTSIEGVPLFEWMKIHKLPLSLLDSIIQKTRDGGAEIVKLLQTGSAYYAPAHSILKIIKAHLFNERAVMPCCAKLNGEYGVNDLYMGVPVIIGKNGVEAIVELDLNAEERALFSASTEAVRSLCALV